MPRASSSSSLRAAAAGRRRRPAYNRVQQQADEEDASTAEEQQDSSVVTPSRAATSRNSLPADSTALLQDRDDIDDDAHDASLTLDEDDKDALPLVILDPAHNRFTVRVHKTTATVADLKQAGSKVHKVPKKSQRLIYRGKLLDDNDRLSEIGITDPETILHLFPKPRVVVQSSSSVVDTRSSASHGAGNEGGDDDDDTVTGGAHVPQIILDPDEAEQRASILVLGSDEVLEAQNNVKLLSLLLLIICSMELLALLTVMLGVPEEDGYPGGGGNSTQPPSNHSSTPDSYDYGDDFFSPSDASQEAVVTMRPWRITDSFDLVISTLGFYVATLGIKATTENTLRLARRYLVGIVVTGISWNVFYYFMNVQAERRADEHRVERNHNNGNDDEEEYPPMDDSDFYVQALFAMMLPALVWFLCCIRAWQFHRLLQEAEEEATERIRNEISDLEQGGAVIVGNDASGTSTSNNGDRGGDQELTLQNASATIT